MGNPKLPEEEIKKRKARYMRDYYANNPEQAKKNARRSAQWQKDNPKRCAEILRKKKYGLLPEQFDLMIEQQKGLCAICFKFMNNPNVDHNHKTKQNRALLCGECNRGVGMFFENINNLQSAINYLKSWGV